MRTRFAGVVTVALLATTACSAESIIAKERPAAEAKLSTLAAAAKRVKEAPRTTAESRLRAPKEKVVLCHSRGGVSLRDCNAVVLWADTLIAPARFRQQSNNPSIGGVSFWHESVVTHAAQVLDGGFLIHEDLDPTAPGGKLGYKEEKIPQSAKGVRVWFEDLEALKWVFVLKNDPPLEKPKGSKSWSVGVFLIDAKTGAEHGSTHVEVSCSDVSYVYANGPNAGGYAGSSSCINHSGRNAFNLALLSQIPSIEIKAQ